MMLGSARTAHDTGEAMALDLCDRLFAEHLCALEACFGAPALGLADLPPLTGERIEPDQLRVVPPLFWASEVEAAGLLAMVEALAAAAVRGTFVEPVGDGIHRLVAFHRDRHHRFTQAERISLYSRLFDGDGGTDPNTEFPGLFGALVGALAALGVEPPIQSTAYLQARIAVVASELCSNLSERTAGVTAFAAREIVATIRRALAILGHAGIADALGGGGPWAIIERSSRRFLGRTIQPRPHLVRARAGLTLLTWLAREGTRLEDRPASVLRGDPVVGAALDWRAASEAI
jgi:hypothetical protein